jgi:hypothetical protein
MPARQRGNVEPVARHWHPACFDCLLSSWNNASVILTPSYAALLSLLCLALVHLFAGKLRFLDQLPRSGWLSLAGGISVAYAFIHLMPELQEHQKVLAAAAGQSFAFVEHHAYLVALLGLVTFYGLERVTKESRREQHKQTGADVPSVGVFWLSMGSFSIYNALVGYLLLRQAESTARNLIFFTLAMALHFVVNDFGLREHHKDLYTRIGRWVVAAAVLAGGLLGASFEVKETAVSVLVAFLTGGVILNVLKEELPEERASRFSAFAAGAAGYAVLLLLF